MSFQAVFFIKPFFVEGNWTRLCFFYSFIFKQRFAVAMKMFSPFLRELLTFAVNSLSLETLELTFAYLETVVRL